MTAVFNRTVIAACLGSAVIAGIFTALTSPVNHLDSSPSAAPSVNRSLKGSRLPLRPPVQTLLQTETSPTAVSPEVMPAGCEPAFSPIAEPDRAGIFRRCAT